MQFKKNPQLSNFEHLAAKPRAKCSEIPHFVLQEKSQSVWPWGSYMAQEYLRKKGLVNHFQLQLEKLEKDHHRSE